MKVLMIAPQPFRQPRGTPISVFQRLSALAALGHSIDLATYHLGEDVTIPGVRIHRAPRIPFLKEIEIGPSWPKLPLDFLLFCKAVSLLIRNRYDVIHSHEEAAFFSVVLAALFRTRHIYDMHSSLPKQLVNFGMGRHRTIVRLFEVLERWTVKTSDAVITIGSDLEEHVREIHPLGTQVRIENLPVHTNGAQGLTPTVLRERLGLAGRLTIVYTGTLERYQGLDLLIDSAEVVKELAPEMVVLVVGGKPQQVAQWRCEVDRRGLGGHVVFVGAVPLEDVAAYLELADILVSPRTGGLSVPLKIYTYLLSGKPIVATSLPTHTLLLSEDIAILAEPTKEAYAEGIMKLVRHPELGQRLGHQARAFAEKMFNPADYLAKLDAVYKSVHRMAEARTRVTDSPEN